MNIKKIAVRILRYLFLILFVSGLLAALYGVKKMDPRQLRGVFSREGVKT